MAESPALMSMVTASSLIDGNHQLAEPTQDVVQVASLLLDTESLHPRSQGAKDGVHFELRQMLADTHVRSPAKCHVLCRSTRHIEPVRIRKLAFVARPRPASAHARPGAALPRSRRCPLARTWPIR